MKNIMRKTRVLSVLVLTAIILFLCGCPDKTPPAPNAGKNGENVTEPSTLRESDAITDQNDPQDPQNSPQNIPDPPPDDQKTPDFTTFDHSDQTISPETEATEPSGTGEALSTGEISPPDAETAPFPEDSDSKAPPAESRQTVTDDPIPASEGTGKNEPAATQTAPVSETQPAIQTPETNPVQDSGFQQSGGITIDRFLGCTENIASFLASHIDQYLGTPYQGLFRNIDQPWVLMRYKGGYDDPHMNCAGFLSSVFQRCGGDITLLPSESGAYSNAYNWKRLVDENGITRHKFSTIEGALASGIMKKGDLIYIHPTSFETGDCHIGFFWGDSPSDNKFWNSLLRNDYTRERGYDVSGNMITPIIAESDYAYVYVIPVG